MKKIKFIRSMQVDNVEKEINEHLKQGWKLKGNVITHSEELIATMYK